MLATPRRHRPQPETRPPARRQRLLHRPRRPRPHPPRHPAGALVVRDSTPPPSTASPASTPTGTASGAPTAAPSGSSSNTTAAPKTTAPCWRNSPPTSGSPSPAPATRCCSTCPTATGKRTCTATSPTSGCQSRSPQRSTAPIRPTPSGPLSGRAGRGCASTSCPATTAPTASPTPPATPTPAATTSEPGDDRGWRCQALTATDRRRRNPAGSALTAMTAQLTPHHRPAAAGGGLTARSATVTVTHQLFIASRFGSRPGTTSPQHGIAHVHPPIQPVDRCCPRRPRRPHPRTAPHHGPTMSASAIHRGAGRICPEHRATTHRRRPWTSPTPATPANQHPPVPQPEPEPDDRHGVSGSTAGTADHRAHHLGV